jgi:hypothetical protein
MASQVVENFRRIKRLEDEMAVLRRAVERHVSLKPGLAQPGG